MSDVNFYQILGVGRSASADEIRSAYRELVKRYHPDLFPTAGEKAEATEKLRHINEAYAVLGNAERRQRYNQRFIQQKRQPKVRAHAPVAGQRHRTSRSRRHTTPRSRKAKILKARPYVSKKRVGYVLMVAVLVVVFIYASRSEPRLASAWTLMEKLEVSSAKDVSPLHWSRLGHYGSVSECAAVLKQQVRKDEQEGSRAVFDEQKGTMAITVYMKNETAQPRDDFTFQAKPDSSAVADASKDEQVRLQPRANEESTELFQKKGITKRVRTLECRETQRLESESWLQRILRRMRLP